MGGSGMCRNPQYKLGTRIFSETIVSRSDILRMLRRREMYRPIFAAVFSLMSAAAIHAATINPCTFGTLSNYIALGSSGCSVGAPGSIDVLVFNGFQVLPTASTAILPGSVILSPGTGGFGTAGFEFHFTPVANTAQVFEVNFGFNISSLIGRLINFEALGVAGGGGPGTFDSPAVSTLCAGPISSTGGCPTFPAAPNLQADIFEFFAFAHFMGTPVLGVTIDASARGNLGTVQLRNIGVSFADAASVPEPATMGMLAVALSGLVLVRRRKRFLPRRSSPR